MTKGEEPISIKPEAELVGAEDQPDTMLDGDNYQDDPDSSNDDVEGTAWAFEEKAQQAEMDAVLDKELEGTFPTSDPPSSWAGPDVEPERPEDKSAQ
jgi:hypothetical protein